jgi:hypothetical protein
MATPITATPHELYGTGSDDDATISSDYSLPRDMYYDNLTVASGVKLSTSGYKIFVRDTLTINGTVENNASPGTNAQGSSGGAGGTARYMSIEVRHSC